MKKPGETILEKKVTVRRRFEGEVVSVRPGSTLYVRVEMVKMHPKYRKQFTTNRTYAVHDAKGLAKQGDRVICEECRPISKTKRWRLIEVL